MAELELGAGLIFGLSLSCASTVVLLKALEAGWPVILDAAFLHRAERAQALALASALSVPFSIMDCQAPAQVLRERLQARRGDASEATLKVLDELSLSAEPLTAEEFKHVLPASGH